MHYVIICSKSLKHFPTWSLMNVERKNASAASVGVRRNKISSGDMKFELNAVIQILKAFAFINGFC